MLDECVLWERGAGTCPREGLGLTGGQRFLLACKGRHFFVWFWRRALAPCIARHFIHPERRDGWYDRVSNHFLKAYLQLTAKKKSHDLNLLSNHLNFHVHKTSTVTGGVSGIFQPVIHSEGAVQAS
ncbi:hypothetical protein, partial [Aeromonas caviae]|uniref:hypothetical protein n=1 Tax=Aeromonas caviae TaxID=648 RepID=UPI001FC812A6